MRLLKAETTEQDLLEAEIDRWSIELRGTQHIARPPDYQEGDKELVSEGGFSAIRKAIQDEVLFRNRWLYKMGLDNHNVRGFPTTL